MIRALRNHWPEYLMEGALLGIFMVVACSFATLLFDTASPVARAIPSPLLRRVLMGLTMGTTAILLITSRWGQQSGAHMNPSVTWTFFRLGKIEPWDAVFYTLAQFAGGFGGAWVTTMLLGLLAQDELTRYALTLPGEAGPSLAFVAEVGISFLLMFVVLLVSNTARLARFTPWCAGFLVATYITLEAPVSGMSMNPARTMASALGAQVWTALWVYFLAPPLGMLLAATLYRHRKRGHDVFCAKLHHHNDKRCIFRCQYARLQTQARAAA
jgi:aquaporin Z